VIDATSGIVGHWPFDETSGTSAADSIGGRTATHTNGAAVNQTTLLGGGDTGKCVLYDGTNDLTTVPNATALQFSGTNLSIEVVIKPVTIPGSGNAWIVNKDNSYGLCFHNGKLSFVIRDTAAVYNYLDALNASDVVTGSTYHVVATWDATSKARKLYINGVLNNSDTLGNALNVNTAVLGFGGWSTGGECYNGYLDEPALYSVVLDSTTVTAHNNARTSGGSDYQTTIAGESGLVGYWKLDDTSGTTATDSAGTPHNGTHTNGVAVNQTPVLTGVGKAASYDGVNDYTTVANVAAFNFGSSDFTIEALIKPGAIPATGNSFILCQQSSYGLGFRNGALMGLVRDTGGNFNYVMANTSDVSVGNSFHVALTYVNSTRLMTLYVGGVQKAQATAAASPNAPGNPLSFGQYGDGGDWYNGALDEVALYNVAKSQATLATHAAAANLPPPSGSGGGSSGGGGGGTGTPIPRGPEAQYQAMIVIPAYWSQDTSKFDRAAATMPAGTVLCGAPGFVNSLPWYTSSSAPTGVGSGQNQTRNQSQADAIIRCRTKGLKVLPYIAVNGANAGTGFDGHYSDLNAVKGKIDKAYALYPEYDGIFLDEAPLTGGAKETFMLDVVAHIHAKTGVGGTLVVSNLASYQQYSGAINYGDMVVLAETVWDSSSGFGGPYGSADPGSSDFIAQPSFVDSWTKSKIIYWICGVPNTFGMAASARAEIYNNHNVGNIYLANEAAYFSRWAAPAADPLWSEQANLAPIVTTNPNPPPPDTTPPVISSVATAAGADATTQRVVTCNTDEAATVVVKYGTSSGSYPLSSVANGTPATTHSRTLSGLTPGQTYHYVVQATDAASNVSTTSNATFTTSVPAGDTTPPVVSGAAVGSITASTATVTWSTNETSDSQVEYGATTSYGTSVPSSPDLTLVTAHSVTLTGLAASTTYHARARSRDASNNLGTSGDLTFTTAPAAGAPVATSMSPTTVIAGTGGFTLTVFGANFSGTTVVRVNGAARATTFVSASQVTAAILASDIATAGNVAITVTNG
jgi:hypothetical protein